MLLETTADSLTGIAAWAVGIMTALGGPGAALLIALENLFPPCRPRFSCPWQVSPQAPAAPA